MDPNQTFHDLIESLAELARPDADLEAQVINRQIAILKCETLAEWLKKGGFPPNVTLDGREVSD